MVTNILKYVHFWSPSCIVTPWLASVDFQLNRVGKYTIGSTKLWLPSRKSVESQRGGLSTVLFGHCLSGRWRGGNFLYFFEGSLSLQYHISFNGQNSKPVAEVILHRHIDTKVGLWVVCELQKELWKWGFSICFLLLDSRRRWLYEQLRASIVRLLWLKLIWHWNWVIIQKYFDSAVTSFPFP